MHLVQRDSDGQSRVSHVVAIGHPAPLRSKVDLTFEQAPLQRLQLGQAYSPPIGRDSDGGYPVQEEHLIARARRSITENAVPDVLPGYSRYRGSSVQNGTIANNFKGPARNPTVPPGLQRDALVIRFPRRGKYDPIPLMGLLKRVSNGATGTTSTTQRCCRRAVKVIISAEIVHEKVARAGASSRSRPNEQNDNQRAHGRFLHCNKLFIMPYTGILRDAAACVNLNR